MPGLREEHVVSWVVPYAKRRRPDAVRCWTRWGLRLALLRAASRSSSARPLGRGRPRAGE
jgi:hypothetical protein